MSREVLVPFIFVDGYVTDVPSTEIRGWGHREVVILLYPPLSEIGIAFEGLEN